MKKTYRPASTIITLAIPACPLALSALTATMRKPIPTVALYLCIAFLPGGVTPALAETTTYVCEYVDGEVEDAAVAATTTAIRFLLDPLNDAAYRLSALGNIPVQLVAIDGGFTIMELTSTGEILESVVAEDGRSAHARHPAIFEQPPSSAYDGQFAPIPGCKVCR